MQNITQRDKLMTKNYILAIKKSIFHIKMFSSEIVRKKFL